MIKEEIGCRIRKTRREKEYSQDYVAMKLGISQTAYQRIENGRAEKMDINIIVKIAEILEISPVDLMFKPKKSTVQYSQPLADNNQLNQTNEDLLKLLNAQLEAINKQMELIASFLKKVFTLFIWGVSFI